MRKNILITGMPKSGKSTLLKKLITHVDQKVGFVANEVRKNGERVGFELENHQGEKAMLAHVDFKTNINVGKYYVDIEHLDVMIDSIEHFTTDDLLFLDEIGQMQVFSERFRVLVTKYLDSPNTCIATISNVYSDEFFAYIKDRKDIFLIEINEENREAQENFIGAILKKIAKAKRYISDPERFTIHQHNITIHTDHGTRTLTRKKGVWRCNCDFFQKNNVCSHVIALEAYSMEHGLYSK